MGQRVRKWHIADLPARPSIRRRSGEKRTLSRPRSVSSICVAVAVPKNRPAALAYVSAFVEDAKAAGSVRRALDNAGLKTSTVAPAEKR